MRFLASDARASKDEALGVDMPDEKRWMSREEREAIRENLEAYRSKTQIKVLLDSHDACEQELREAQAIITFVSDKLAEAGGTLDPKLARQIVMDLQIDIRQGGANILTYWKDEISSLREQVAELQRDRDRLRDLVSCGDTQDPNWCYVCDRPANDCVCGKDPSGPLPNSACVKHCQECGEPNGKHKSSCPANYGPIFKTSGVDAAMKATDEAIKMTKSSMTLNLKLDLVKGVEGNSIYLNDYRIAGPKPWGGGTVLQSWRVKAANVLKVLEEDPPAKSASSTPLRGNVKATVEAKEK
jgi:hypothetical protein